MFLPSKTASFISLTLGMASLPEIDFEIPERVDLQRSARMHDDRGVGRFDHRRAPDAVSRRKQRSVVNRRGHPFFQIGPIDTTLAARRLWTDLRVEFSRLRELGPGRRGGRAQAQRHDLHAPLPYSCS